MSTADQTRKTLIDIINEVRRKLGIGPGSVLEWDEVAGQVVLRRAGRYTSEDLHRALFPNGPPSTKTIEEMKAGIESHVKQRYARG